MTEIWKIFEPNKYSIRTKVNLWVLSDLHIGAKTTDIPQLKSDIGKIRKDSYARVILLGDVVEMALKPNMRAEQTISPNKQIPILKKLLSPIKNKIDCIFVGNHERRIRKLTELEYLYDAFEDFAPQARFCGMQGFVNYYTLRQKADSFDDTYLHKFYFHHGIGKSTTPYYLLEKAKRIGIMDVVDAVVMGHGHSGMIHRYTRLKNGISGIEQRIVYGIRCRSYLKHPEYAKEALYESGEIGPTIFHLKDNMEIEQP